MLLRAYHRYRHAFLAIAMLAVTAYVACVRFVSPELTLGIVYVSPATRVFDFIIGVLLWQFHSAVSKGAGTTSIARTVAELLAISIITVAVFFYKDIPACWSLSSYWWIPVCMIILSFCSSIPTNGGYINRILNFSPMIAFGNISFTFYMIHVPFIRTSHIILDKAGIVIPAIPEMLLILAIGIVAAYFCHRILEKPISSFLSRSLAK